MTKVACKEIVVELKRGPKGQKRCSLGQMGLCPLGLGERVLTTRGKVKRCGNQIF